MFESYRGWLESELRLLGNASHHAYSIGQANMAKRALERFDEAVHERADDAASVVNVGLGLEEARRALEALESGGAHVPALVVLHGRLAEALGRAVPAAEGPAERPEP